LLNSHTAQDLTPQNSIQSHLQHTALARAYVLDHRILRNTALIFTRFFVPLSSIAVTFVLPCLLLWNLLLGFGLWKSEFVAYTPYDFISLKVPLLMFLVTLAKGITWVSTYFASFVIVGEVSDVCLGGTASFSKAVYKASIRGVGRLLGTDILYLFVLSVAVAISFILSHFVIEPWAGR
jgi:hypothetical protein